VQQLLGPDLLRALKSILTNSQASSLLLLSPPLLQIKVQQLLGPDLLRAYLAVKGWEAAQQTGNDKLLLRY
jgi:hypothetical protein